MELAVERVLAGTLRVVAVEIEAFALANLAAKTEEGRLGITALYTDVRTFPSRRFRGCFDGVLAGYPCQPFSRAGKRQGHNDPRHLWPYIRRHVAAVRPEWCFFENVEGHVTLGFREVHTSLCRLGYAVEAGLFTASEVGAPQERERLFILAYHQDSIWRLRKEGDTSCNRQRRRGYGSSGQILPNPDSRRLARPCIPVRQQRQGESAIQDSDPSGCGHPMLADDDSAMQPGAECEICAGGHTIDTTSTDRWPADRGQEQHDWEEPRTVEPGMGRTINGIASRVDELRLLGNGVVPSQAAHAFRYLLAAANVKLMEQEDVKAG